MSIILGIVGDLRFRIPLGFCGSLDLVHDSLLLRWRASNKRAEVCLTFEFRTCAIPFSDSFSFMQLMKSSSAKLVQYLPVKLSHITSWSVSFLASAEFLLLCWMAMQRITDHIRYTPHAKSKPQTGHPQSQPPKPG